MNMPAATRRMLQMARTLPADAPVPSPCVSVCQMDEATGLCGGCLRTLSEIAAWSRLGEADKRRVWRALPQRAREEASS